MQIVFNGRYAWHDGDPWWVPPVAKPSKKGQVNARLVGLHEIGHALVGLDHSTEQATVMAAHLRPVPSVLSSDDIAGAKANYP